MIDPITLIVAALAAGASAGIGDTASQAVKDAYAGLKSLVTRRMARSPRALETLAEHEADPDTFEKPLAKQLTLAGAQSDPGILRAAERLLSLVNAAGPRTAYHVNVSGGKVGNIGEGGQIGTMN